MTDLNDAAPPVPDLGSLQKRLGELEGLLRMAEAECIKAEQQFEEIEAELNGVRRTILETTAKLLGLPMGPPMMQPPQEQMRIAPVMNVMPPSEPEQVPGEPTRQRRFGALRTQRGG